MRGASRNLYKGQGKNRRVIAILACFFIILTLFFTFDRYAGSYAKLANKVGVRTSSQTSNSTANEKSDPIKEDFYEAPQEQGPSTSQESIWVDSENSNPSENEGARPEAEKFESKISCNTADADSGVCEIEGEVRIHGPSASVSVISSQDRTWKVRPFARKNDPRRTSAIPEVTIASLNGESGAPRCNIRHRTSAVVFALSTVSGDAFSDFQDILIPLYETTRRFNGEVQLLVMNYNIEWINKYQNIIKQLSRHEVIDFSSEAVVHCYAHAIVGLHSPKASNQTMIDFTKFLRAAYKLGRDCPVKLGEVSWQKPKLLVLSSSSNSRKITNVDDISTLGESFGFDVVVKDLALLSDAEQCALVVNDCDVLIGVYGAGLANMVFLPTDAVVIQVVPYGNIEKMAEDHFKRPAVAMELRYLQYDIDVEESTLTELYPRDHAVFRDPNSIHQKGFEAIEEVYLTKQNVKLNVTRFSPVLLKALAHLIQ